MAKVTFTKLAISKTFPTETITWNDQEIEVKKYLPIEDKIKIVEKVLNESVDDNGYYNVIRLNVYIIVEAILAYTNITVTEKQREDVLKLYDAFISSGLSKKILQDIAEEDFLDLQDFVTVSIDNIYKYRNSAAGIMEAISRDYSDLELDAEKIKDDIANPNNLTLLKDVLTKLG